jgi:hypothetical protein
MPKKRVGGRRRCFGSAFKKMLGAAPMEYRKSMQASR